uniref:Transketolase n=1 Tax=Sphaerisporangium sp. SANK 60911 TaxID=1354075 RepID=V5YSA2_9ACTN|nr:putative transketolase [Sphaerisporangium sp. SANK 60911]
MNAATTPDDRAVAVIRGLVMDTIERAGSGHPGAALALAPWGYALYRRVLRANPRNPLWPDRDRVVFSAGHVSALQYALLHLSGHPVSLEDLRSFRTLGSATPGHPEHGRTPGVEATTGPLGQGFATAVGMALAERYLAHRFNRPGRPVVDHRTFVLVSDGDLMEGVSQEALSLAGQLRLGRLVVCYDSNQVTIDGTTALTFDQEDQEGRFAASGWAVEHVRDTEDTAALTAALARAGRGTDRPTLLILHTTIGHPVESIRGTPAAHGGTLGPEVVARTKAAIGLDPARHFDVPEDVRADLDLGQAGAEAEKTWRERFEQWSRTFPELREEWDRCHREAASGVPVTLDAAAMNREASPRNASRAALEQLRDRLPTMVGGAADLVDSTKTSFPGEAVYTAAAPGRNIAFGVREHVMATAVNGLALHGGMVKPYGSTFLAFSDYMRPAVRLSALMRLPVLWLWTHDSIAIGPDGPTHQPVEHLASLRAIPGLWVMRPCDANETAQAWQAALARADGPVALILARQVLPNLPETGARAEGVTRGGYVLWEPSRPPSVVLLAAGSEVHPALAAAKRLEEDGLPARVVSLPCWELFEHQDAAYRESVLGPDGLPRLAVEAASPLGWHRWTGPAGAVLGMTGYGASADGATLLAHYGFTAERVAEEARRVHAAATAPATPTREDR